MTPLWVVVGPTASGKTSWAVRLAERIGGEVVSADSVQVYREFNIGSGKPSEEELALAPHHLVDAVDPREPMDAARWLQLAERSIEEIRSRGRVPIVCGGTFLYVKALLFGLAAAPPANDELRASHREWAEREGRAALHARLATIDPERAAKLAPNDFVRVSRALEVHELTGRPLSAWQAEHGFRRPRHAAKLVGIRWSPSELAERIERRVRGMFELGFREEVDRLVARGYRSCRAMGAVGYKQVLEALDEGRAQESEALIEEVARATRIFARRQRTWLRDQPVTWLSQREAHAPDLGVLATQAHG